MRAARTPTFYEAGQDVTGIADPQASYREFMDRIVKEYAALALIFEFVNIDAEKSIYDQHKQIRTLFQEGKRRPWTDFNGDAVADWLTSRPEVRIAVD